MTVTYWHPRATTTAEEVHVVFNPAPNRTRWQFLLPDGRDRPADDDRRGRQSASDHLAPPQLPAETRPTAPRRTNLARTGMESPCSRTTTSRSARTTPWPAIRARLVVLETDDRPLKAAGENLGRQGDKRRDPRDPARPVPTTGSAMVSRFVKFNSSWDGRPTRRRP